MQVGGLRRIEVRGERPELSYPRSRKERFTNETLRDGIYKCVGMNMVVVVAVIIFMVFMVFFLFLYYS